MITKKCSCLLAGALAAICFMGAQTVLATTMITFVDSAGNPSPEDPASPTYANETDYSPAGLDLGKLGYLFFNFGQAADTGEKPVGENRADALPSWIGADYDPLSPTYSFGDDVGLEAFSRGGVGNWASLTLPNGASGLSGALVDPATADNSNNSIQRLDILPGAPSSFLLHVVTDNTQQEHDAVKRLRAREDVSGSSSKLENLSFNFIPDVYTFRYDGVVAGDFIKIQLNSGLSGESASITGIMFDVIPEPTSAMLLLLGSVSLSLVGRRRR